MQGWLSGLSHCNKIRIPAQTPLGAEMGSGIQRHYKTPVDLWIEIRNIRFVGLSHQQWPWVKTWQIKKIKCIHILWVIFWKKLYIEHHREFWASFGPQFFFGTKNLHFRSSDSLLKVTLWMKTQISSDLPAISKRRPSL